MKDNIIYQTLVLTFKMFFSGCLPWLILLVIIWAIAMILYP